MAAQVAAEVETSLRMGQRANVTPIDLIRAGVEMTVAQTLQAGQQGVDVGFGFGESAKRFGIVFGGSVGHGCVSGWCVVQL